MINNFGEFEEDPKPNVVPDMKKDIKNCEWILAKVRDSESYSQNLYAAICNMRWQKQDVFPILSDEYWTASWRSAGGIVSNLRGQGDYMDWYCSGIMEEGQYISGFVSEGTVTDEIREDLHKLGWIPSEWPDDK